LSQLVFDNICFLCKREIKPDERIYGIKRGKGTNIKNIVCSITPETLTLQLTERKYYWRENPMPQGKLRMLWGSKGMKVCHCECLDELLNIIVD
jgi:hypothetical protein